MNRGKEFKFPWNQFILKESFSGDMRGAIGRAINIKVLELPPEEQLAIAVIVDDLEQKPVDKCDPEALADSNPLNIVVMSSVNENGLNFLGRQVTCAMIDSDVSRVGGFFEWAQSPNCARLLQPATNFARRNIEEFFGLKQLQQPAPAGITERDQAAFTGKFGGDPRFDADAPDPTVVEPTPQAPEQENQPLVPQDALKTSAHNYFEGKLEDLFKCFKLDHPKFILAIGMITYWETLIEQDFLGLKKHPKLFMNAKMIAEIEINWLRRIIITPIGAKIEQPRIENRKALKQIAAKEPEALKQLQLKGPQAYKQLTLKGDPDQKQITKIDPEDPEPEVKYEYFLPNDWGQSGESRRAQERLFNRWKKVTGGKFGDGARAFRKFKKDLQEFVDTIGPHRDFELGAPDLAESNRFARNVKMFASGSPGYNTDNLHGALRKVQPNTGAHRILQALAKLNPEQARFVAVYLTPDIGRRKVGGDAGSEEKQSPKKAPSKTNSGFPERGALEEQKQNNRWKQLAGI
jgi:hypothetical protein